jgi:hypothetical protein
MLGYDFSRAAELSTSNNISGGWEVWLQVELAMHLRDKTDLHNVTVIRECPYPGSRLRCDFFFSYGDRRDPTYVELKCQLPGSDDPIPEALSRFKEDIGKQRSFLPTTVGFCLLATRGPWEPEHIAAMNGIKGTSSAFVLVATDGENVIYNYDDPIMPELLQEDYFFLIGISP